MTTVVFAEKNKAAEKIAEILSSGSASRTSIGGVSVYTFSKGGEKWGVMGLRGHIMGYDFPEELNNWRAVDPAILLDTEPIKSVTQPTYSKAIKALSSGADTVILACDYDREGENIGFEAKTIAGEVNKKASILRARFSSLEQGEVIRAFDNLLEPNENLAMAAEARQILDLQMGAAFTRFCTLSVRQRARTEGILSIGPCQTPTCGFVYEREKAIRNFVPRDFWRITSIFTKKEHDFTAQHIMGKIFDGDVAASIFDSIKNCKSGVVVRKKVEEQQTQPPYPLNTTEFLKRSSKYLGISSDKALEVAEKLYLEGIVSYPRTDTNLYGDGFPFMKILSSFADIKCQYFDFVKHILSKPISPREGKTDGKDHPPIHPVKYVNEATLKRIDPNAPAVFDLIARHFLATLLPPLTSEKTRYRLAVGEQSEEFNALGTVILDDGWHAVYTFETLNENTLPYVEMDESVAIKDITMPSLKTKAPKNLTEAELLSLMDNNGIGTKSTAPTHIETNKKRGYFEQKGKSIVILDTGFMLMQALESATDVLIKPEIRSIIETRMQDIEDGKKNFEDVLFEVRVLVREMYAKLSSNKDSLVNSIVSSLGESATGSGGEKAVDAADKIGTCPDCGGILHIIRTEKGRFVGCNRYPACSCTYPLPKNGAIVMAKSKKCMLDEGHGIVKIGGKYFWSVGIGPCFTCEKEKECYPPDVVGACPRCDAPVIIVRLAAKKTRFLSCSKRCGFTTGLPKSGTLTLSKDACEWCEWKMLRVTDKGNKHEFCPNPVHS